MVKKPFGPLCCSPVMLSFVLKQELGNGTHLHSFPTWSNVKEANQGVSRVWFGQQNTDTQQHLKLFLDQTFYKWSENSFLQSLILIYINQTADIVDLSHRESRAPLLLQDVQANLSLAKIQDKFLSNGHKQKAVVWNVPDLSESLKRGFHQVLTIHKNPRLNWGGS